MTDRKRFESIISASPYEKSVARWPNLPVKFSWPGGYKDLSVDLAWWMWQASRKQALSDALGECQAVINGCFEVDREPARWCFDAIRGLANPEGEQG